MSGGPSVQAWLDLRTKGQRERTAGHFSGGIWQRPASLRLTSRGSADKNRTSGSSARGGGGGPPARRLALDEPNSCGCRSFFFCFTILPLFETDSGLWGGAAAEEGFRSLIRQFVALQPRGEWGGSRQSETPSNSGRSKTAAAESRPSSARRPFRWRTAELKRSDPGIDLGAKKSSGSIFDPERLENVEEALPSPLSGALSTKSTRRWAGKPEGRSRVVVSGGSSCRLKGREKTLSTFPTVSQYSFSGRQKNTGVGPNFASEVCAPARV